MIVAPHKPSIVDRTAFLRVLSIYKFAQTAIMAALGLATLRLVRPEVAAGFKQWVQNLPVGYVQHVSERFLSWISGPQSHRVQLLGAALFAYAALFLIEAVGLWWQRRWAEWLTVVATATLIPPEVYECLKHPSVTLFLLLLVNCAVVWLLAKRLQHELAMDAKHRATSLG